MDRRGFDNLARSLAAGATRRSALKALAGGTLAAAIAAVRRADTQAQAGIAACSPVGRRCRGNAECCSRRCVEERGADRCACRPTGDRCRSSSECCTGNCGADRRCNDARG